MYIYIFPRKNFLFKTLLPRNITQSKKTTTAHGKKYAINKTFLGFFYPILTKLGEIVVLKGKSQKTKNKILLMAD